MPVGMRDQAAQKHGKDVAGDVSGHHRAQMRRKLLGKGGVALTELELLEMLLYAGAPRGDTKPLAKRLMKYFGSLSAILRAELAQLQSVNGAGDAAVSAIKLPKRSAYISTLRGSKASRCSHIGLRCRIIA